MQNHHDHALNSKQAARYLASMCFNHSSSEHLDHIMDAKGLPFVYHNGDHYYTTIDLEAWAFAKYQAADNVVVFPAINSRIDWFKPVETVELALAA